MNYSKIKPENIKSPMQLMASWFVMLIALVSILLTAAFKVTKPEWAAGYLVICSTVLILIVIICVLLMLTKFRPHLQDSDHYAVWLKDQKRYVSHGKTETQTYKPEKLEPIVGDSAEDKLNFIKKARLCNIDITNAPRAEEIMKSLNKEGFIATIYKMPRMDHNFDTVDESTGIWVGANLEPEAVLRAIEISLNIWPQLKYLHLSTDSDGPAETHDQLFLGGADVTAKTLKLTQWNSKELLSIPKTISKDEFHRLIRQKNS